RRAPPPPGNPLAYLTVMAQEAFGWFVERGMLPATRVDPVVFRGLLRVFHMLERPERLARDPELVLRSIPMLARGIVGQGPQEPESGRARGGVPPRGACCAASAAGSPPSAWRAIRSWCGARSRCWPACSSVRDRRRR